MTLTLRRTALAPLALVTVMVSGAFLLAGVLLPQAADALLRLLLATLAAVYVFSRGYEILAGVRSGDAAYSPFQDPEAGNAPPTAPRPVRNLAAQLTAADDPERARDSAIPTAVRAVLLEEAGRRLQERHGLDPRESSHGPAVRALVSEPTWKVIRPVGAGEGAGSDAAESNGGGLADRVPLARLPEILDDVEAL